MLKSLFILTSWLLKIAYSVQQYYIDVASNCTSSCAGTWIQPFKTIVYAVQMLPNYQTVELLLINNGGSAHQFTTASALAK